MGLVGGAAYSRETLLQRSAQPESIAVNLIGTRRRSNIIISSALFPRQ